MLTARPARRLGITFAMTLWATLLGVAGSTTIAAGAAPMETGMPRASTSVSAREAKVWWAFTEPIGEATGSFTLIQGRPTSKYRFEVGDGAWYAARKLTWSNWGGRRVTGTGSVRYCDSYGEDCTPAVRARIILTGREPYQCYRGPMMNELRTYTLYRTTQFKGFPGVDGRQKHTVPTDYQLC